MTVRKVTRTVEELWTNCIGCGTDMPIRDPGSAEKPLLCYCCACKKADAEIRTEHSYLVGAVVTEFSTTGTIYPDLAKIRVRSSDGRLFDVSGLADSDGNASLEVEEIKP